MSIFWTLTASFLYGEMAVIAVLLIPMITSQRWRKIFNSNLIRTVSVYSTFYFRACILLLFLMVLEAVRAIFHQNKAYNSLKEHPHELRPETESLVLMRLFRAQRNLYISGFALFLWFIFHRLVKLISEHARVTASNEASLNQARSATDVAEKLLSEAESARSDKSEESLTVLQSEMEDLRLQLEAKTLALHRMNLDLEMVRKQAAQTNLEYDRVCNECQQLQIKLTEKDGNSGDKKLN